MAWLAEHGLIGRYDDYDLLPLAVLEDARLWMQGQAAGDMMREATRGDGG